VATGFDNLDDNKKVTYNNIFGDNMNQYTMSREQEKLNRDLITDTNKLNSSLREALNIGRIENTGFVTPGSGDTGRVVTEDNTRRIVTPNQKDSLGNSLSIDITDSQDKIRRLHESFTAISREASDGIDNIAQKIAEIKAAGGQVSSDLANNFQIIREKTNQLREVYDKMNNAEVHLIDVNAISREFQNAQNELKNAIQSFDITGVLSDQINHLLEQNIDTSQIDTVKTKVVDVVNKISTLGNISTQFFDVSIINQLVDVMNIASDAMERVARSGQTFGQAAENIAQTSADSAEAIASDAQNMQQMAQQNADMIRLLREQYQESAKTFENVDEIAKNFFKNVGGYVAANVSDVINQLSSAVQSHDVQSIDELLDPDNVKGLSFASSQLIQIINELNNIDDKDNNLDIYMSTLTEIQKFAESINESQSNISLTFAKLLSESGNFEQISRIVTSIKNENVKFNEIVNLTLDNFRKELSGLIEKANQQNEQKIKNASIAGTEEYNQVNLDISNMFTKTSIGGVNASQNDLANVMRHMTSAELEMSRVSIPGLYRYLPGNFLNNRELFKGNVRNAQRTNFVAGEQLSKVQTQLDAFRAAGDSEHTKKTLRSLADSVEANAKAHLEGLKNINLHRGQYKLLNENDKGTLDSFLKSSDNAAASLRDAISAIEAIDPQHESLQTLKNINNELSSTANSIKDIKDDSFDVKDVLSGAVSGVKKAHGLFVGGMGLMGLGMLAPTLGNLLQIVGGGFEAEKRSGIYRYELAKSDFAIGNSINESRNNFYVDTMADEYYKLSQGQIGWDQVKNYAIAMRRNVGGHYGMDPSQSRADMDKITTNTFGIAQMYGLNENDVSSFMKTYYKDLGHSADQASYALVQMARSAQAAGIPVSQYINNMTSMMSSLREYGVEGEKIQQFIRDLTGRGMRIEDASQLLTDTAHAGRNMGFNDWGASGFYGIMAGQGGDIFGNIVSGMMPVRSDGNINQEYYSTMAQRLFFEAGMMGGIGGGPGSYLGASLLMDTLSKRGYSQRSVSMLGDAYLNNDMQLFEDLLKEADEEKENSEEGLKNAMSEARQKIEASGNQVSEITKAQTSVALAEKHLGEVIHSDLQEPLSNLRKGFDDLLTGFVSSVELLIKELKKFSSSSTGQAIGNFLGDMSPGGLALAGLGGLAAAGAGVKGVKILGELTKYSIFKDPSKLSTGAKVVNSIPGWGKLLGAGAVLGGGIAFSKTQTFSDISDTVSGLFTGLYNIFTSGDFKAQLVPNESNNNKKAEKSAQTSFIQEQATRQDQNTDNQIANDEQTNEILDGQISAEEQQIIDEYQKTYNETHQKIKDQDDKIESNVAIASEQDFEAIRQRDEARLLSEHNGMPGYATAMLLGTGAVGLAGLYANRRMSNANIPPVIPTSNGQRYNPQTTSSSSAVQAETNARQYASSGRLANAKDFLKASGKTTAALGVLSAGATELMDYYENPDKFTTKERIGRFGISAASQTAGMLVGGAVGSLVGPVGTFVGAAAGGYLGGLAGDRLKKIFKISDEDGRMMGDKYLDASKWASGKYTKDTNSLINSNDNRARAAKDNLEAHGVKMENLTKDQQRYMDDLFNQLKQLNYSDISAAYLSAEHTAQMHKKEWEETYDDPQRRLKALQEGFKDATNIKDNLRYYRVALQSTDESMEGFGNQDRTAKQYAKEALSFGLNSSGIDWEKIKKGDYKELSSGKEKFTDWMRSTFVSDSQGNQVTDSQIDNMWKRIASFGTTDRFTNAEKEKFVNDMSSTVDMGEYKQRLEFGTKQSQFIDDYFSPMYFDGSKSDINSLVESTTEFAGLHASEKYPQSILKEEGNNAESDNQDRSDGINRTAKNVSQMQANNFDLSIPGSGENKYWVRQRSSVSTEGMQQQTLSAMDALGKWFADKTGHKLVITAGTDGDHSSNGSPTGHDAGWKVDVNDWYGPEGLQGGYLVNADGTMGSLGQEFIKYGNSLGLGMNWEGDHFDISAAGEQWEGPNAGTNFGGFGTPGASAPDVDALSGASSNKNTNDDFNTDLAGTVDAAKKSITDRMSKEVGAMTNYRDKFATGRLILDGTTASFRDRDVYMTPTGVKNRLNLSSGAQESSLYGFNTQGYFSWNKDKKQFEQFDTSGAKMIENMENKFRKDHKESWGKITYNQDKISDLENSDKAVLDSDAWLQESVRRYETPTNERLEEDFQNDLDEKHSVSIAMNVIGGGVTKQWVIQAMTRMGHSIDETTRLKEGEQAQYVRMSHHAAVNP